MLRTIHCYGPLESLAGTNTLRLDVDTPLMLFSGLRSQIKGFRQFADDHKLAVVLTNADGKEVSNLTPEEFDMQLGKATDVHLVPEVEGSGFEAAAIMSAIAEGAYLTAAYYIAVNVAIAVVAGAVMTALAPSPSTSAGAARPDERPSYIYNGAVNVVEQGYPVPLVYGEHMVGSIVVSAGVSIEDIPYVPEQEETPESGGTPQPGTLPVEDWQWGGA